MLVYMRSEKNTKTYEPLSSREVKRLPSWPTEGPRALERLSERSQDMLKCHGHFNLHCSRMAKDWRAD